jgi:hypothetical protein
VKERLRKELERPDLEKHLTLKDAVELWIQTTGRHSDVESLLPVTKAIRRIAEAMDFETLLKRAFADLRDLQLAEPERFPQPAIIEVQRELLFWIASDRWLEREIALLQRDRSISSSARNLPATFPLKLRTIFPPRVWLHGKRARASTHGGRRSKWILRKAWSRSRRENW